MQVKIVFRVILLVNAFMNIKFIILQNIYSFKILFQYLFTSVSLSRFIIKNEEVMKKKGTAFRIKECNMSLKKDGFIPSTIYV